MTEKIPVNLKYYDPRDEINKHLTPTTQAELIEETDDKQFISAREKERFDGKQDALGYTPLNRAGDVMQGPLILNSNEAVNDFQAVTKAYVDRAIAQLVNGSPAALDTLYELAEAISNDPNFAISVTTTMGTKVDKGDTAVIAEPNKILYLNQDGELSTNAATATRLKNAFGLELNGDVQGSASIDGSGDVSVDVEIPQITNEEIDSIFPSPSPRIIDIQGE